MPLTSEQKAALALRIAVARFLDDFAAPPGQTTWLKQATSRVAVWISSATEVTSHEIIQSHLQGAAADLKEWASAQADSIPCDRIMDAVLAIQISATGVQAGDGDGPARCFATGPSPCLCGFLALAQLVEGHALACYLRAAEAANSAIHWPEVTYETKITPDDLNKLTPFKIGGEADTSARTVTLTVKDENLSATDLCQVAYVLFHEVVCHAFQGATLAHATANCVPQCHWTEGWMDTVAFEMAVNSATNGSGVREWLPLTGPDARSAMAKVHDARFEKPVGLKADDAKIRRAARRAFTELQLAFQETGTAISKADAEALAGQFSVLANARAGSKALKGLSNHLQMALLSKYRDKDRVYTAEACLRFLEHCDIDQLLQDLQSLPQHSVVS